MEEKIIDCAKIRTPEDLHEAFRTALAFPEWYGNNLGPYGKKVKKVIAAAAVQNTDLDLYL